MSTAEERQAKALENIAHYLKGLVPVISAINQNLVDFAKTIESSKESGTFPKRYVPSEGYTSGFVGSVPEKKAGE